MAEDHDENRKAANSGRAGRLRADTAAIRETSTVAEGHHDHERSANAAQLDQAAAPGGAQLISARYPYLALQFVRNLTRPWISLDDMTFGLTDRCEWRCTTDPAHEHWVTQLRSRTNAQRQSGCPTCARAAWRLARPGRSLQDLFPEVAAQFVENQAYPGRGPDRLRPSSVDRCLWTCSRRHVWDAVVSSRTQGSGCPKCKQHGVSRFESEVAALITATTGLCVKVDHRITIADKNERLDLYLPDLDLSIELDPLDTHKKRIDRDRRKSQLLIEAGVDFIRLRQQRLPPVPAAIVITTRGTNPWDWVQVLAPELRRRGAGWRTLSEKEVATIRGAAARAWMEQCAAWPVPSAQDKAPHLALEFVENETHAGVGPEWLQSGSGDMCRWRCQECSHVWRAMVYVRAKGHGCAACHWKKISRTFGRPNPGESLLDLHPTVAAEFVMCIEAPDLAVGDLLPCSNKMCRWRCSTCGYEWSAAPNSRIGQGSGCMACGCKRISMSRIKPKFGESLLDLYPEVAAELVGCLDNPVLTAADLKPQSNMICRWRCSTCEHEWDTRPSHRTKRKQSCPQCAMVTRAVSLRGRPQNGSLLEIFPILALQFHRCIREPAWTAGELGPFSRIVCEWKCPECGHIWKKSAHLLAVRFKRTRKSPCPRCGITPISGEVSSIRPRVSQTDGTALGPPSNL